MYKRKPNTRVKEAIARADMEVDIREYELEEEIHFKEYTTIESGASHLRYLFVSEYDSIECASYPKYPKID